MSRFRTVRTLLAVLAGALLLSGCNFNVYSLPLPGGADVGSDPMTITVQFEDVLDLVPKSAVKVNDVTVGQITDVALGEADGRDVAEVTLKLQGDVDLPENATATIRQTSLLGEKFVSLEPPTDSPSSQPLADGDEIPIDRTGANPEVEQVLGALSLILNGGGVAQLHTITNELNQALEGREDTARSLLTQIDSFVGQAAERKQDIVDAIVGLKRLAVAARGQQSSIDSALDELPSALKSINGQREGLVDMLQSLDRLSNVGVRVIKATKQDTLDTLRDLQPVLTELSNSGQDFVNAFNVFLTFPFVDEVVGRDPQVARNLQVGDYTNLSIELDLDLTNLTLPGLPGAPELPANGPSCLTLDDLPTTPGLDLNDLLDLDNLCQGALNALTKCLNNPTNLSCLTDLPGELIDTVCNTVGALLGTGCNGQGSGGGHGGGHGGGGGGGLGGLLGGLTGGGGGLLGLNRPAPTTSDTGERSAAGSGPTSLADLADVYDPGLVSGLAGPLAVQP